ncbi:MAG: hypothetical protein J1E02_02130 [Coprobacter sp.]|nr:hypothetical protein [Coprobacter sp.]
MARNKNIIVFFLWFLSQISVAQFALEYDVEANAIAGNGGYAPFYLMNNRQGLVSFRPNNGYLRAGIHKNMESGKRFSYAFGFDMVGAYGRDAPVYVQQLYGELKYRCLGLSVGAKEMGNVMANDRLSSGSMIWSGNARPIPQVRLGIPHFVKVTDWLQLKGEISYGAFLENRYQDKHRFDNSMYTRNVLYHRKYVMFKFEKDRPFYGIVGVDMAAQFGGTNYNNVGTDKTIRFRSDLAAFMRVFVPLSGTESDPGIDQINVVGNHVGSYWLEVGYKQKEWNTRAYYEHYFDDHSGMGFRNKLDGLWGIEFSTPHRWPVTGFVFEVMNSTHQSGPFLWDKTDEIPVQVSGGDYYYGHVCYNGWTHQGHTIGTPFITSPGYNTDGYLGFKNSRSRAFHVGADGYIVPELTYRVLVGHQRGWGNPYVPFTHISHEFSTLIDFDYRPKKWQGWKFNLSGAFDKGTLFGDNWGIQFGVRKEGTLFRSKK